MSAGGSGAIGPVSVRYAAQIRELLHAQAVQRMAADQEAARARAEADRTARMEAAAKAEEARASLHARIEPPPPPASPTTAAPPDPAPAKAETRPTTGALIDIQA